MSRDDLTLETLLERMPADPELWRLSESGTSVEEERQLRAWVELAGLLGLSCAEEAPSACRDRLLRAVVDDAAGAGAESRQSEEGDVVPIGIPREMPPSPSASRRTVWTLAAVLTACCLGLAFLAGRLIEQRARIETLQARQEPALAPAALAREAEENRRLRDRLRMVTSVARYAYPLEPASAGSAAPASKADGVVYVCGAHQQWYLALNGLEPAPPGREYRLWFLTESGPRAGGRLEVTPGEPVELEASTLPEGTRGFSVTLEPSESAPDEPHGTMVLLSEDSVSL